MRYALLLLAVVGIVVSAFALREHYRTDTSPCSINDKWDCGIVNHSPYAMLWKIPVAIIGIAGYLLMAVMSLRRAYRLLLADSLKQYLVNSRAVPVGRSILPVPFLEQVALHVTSEEHTSLFHFMDFVTLVRLSEMIACSCAILSECSIMRTTRG